MTEEENNFSHSSNNFYFENDYGIFNRFMDFEDIKLMNIDEIK